MAKNFSIVDLKSMLVGDVDNISRKIIEELIEAREKILKMKLAVTPRLNHKVYSVCVVSSKEEIPVVEQIIKELDSFEYDYLPDGWVSDLDRTVYHGKFDIDTLTLVKKCYERGIDIDIVQTEEPW